MGFVRLFARRNAPAEHNSVPTRPVPRHDSLFLVNISAAVIVVAAAAVRHGGALLALI